MTRSAAPPGPEFPNIVQADDMGLGRAAALLRSGQIVAVPTETVYGLAANAADANAVAKIYAAKGRPDFNPLIVHVADEQSAAQLVHMTDKARQLAAAFWPGPLTMVLPKRSGAPVTEAVTAGLPTLAVRCPAHRAMQKLLSISGLCLAAPSANKSGAISPTEAQHVLQSLGDRIPLIVDGGACPRGVESTIVALDGEGRWRLLRPGPILTQEIAQLIGPQIETSHDRIEAPGQLASHYAPSKPLRLNARTAQQNEWLIGFGTIEGNDNLSPAGNTAEAAANLYAALHRADAAAVQRIAVAPVTGPMAEAINDRLARAAH